MSKKGSALMRRLGALIFLFPTLLHAQTVTLTAPLSNVEVKEGDDFATDVLGNPWDFNERRDIGWEEGWVDSTINVNGGIWQGTNDSQGAWLMPLYPGHKGTLYTEPLPGDRKLPKQGFLNRIDSSKYYHLSYRADSSYRSTFAIYWENDESKGEYLGDPTSPHRATNDGYFHATGYYPNPAGWRLYSFDMRDPSPFVVNQGSWSGDIFTLRLDPSIGAPKGSKTRIDWMRLTDPNSAPMLDIRWNSSGTSFFTVVTVYVDTDNKGHDGSPVARFANDENNGLYRLPTAILPPGDHYFYVCAQDIGINMGAVRCSNYSARLRINAKPHVAITAPSRITGADYASTVVGNPWDMDGSTNGLGDVSNLGNCAAQGRPEIYCLPVFQQFSNPAFVATGEAELGGRVFNATANPPLPGAFESDVQVHLNVSNSTPIDPTRYRYLTYRMKVDPSNHPTIADKLREGWVSRPVYWNTDIVADGGRFKAHLLYEGWQTYTIDLWDPLFPEHVPGLAPPTPWTSFGRVQNFRIDPLETAVPTNFSIDWVKLTTENYPTNDIYTVTFDLDDRDSSSFTVEIFVDDDNSGFNGERIARLTGLGKGSHSYDWNTSGLQDGQYYIYLTVSDGRNTTRVYSTVPVVIGNHSFRPQPRLGTPPLDFDGDGVSDQIVYRPWTGTYFQNRSTQGIVSIPWGGPTFVPVHADIDGDGITDIGLVTDINGVYFWYFIRSSDGALYWTVWGVTGDIIAMGDYNGNGRDEVAIFRDGLWYILDENHQGHLAAWGLPGDVPMPRDFDGDGIDDFAIWRPADGNWWIINSGFGRGDSSDPVTVVQWGLPGDVPVAADWTGDGREDPAVWRPSDGVWYIRDIATGETSATQWGLPGDRVMVGDFNGDGRLDLTVYRDAFGMWYHNFRDGTATAVQFGLPGDLLPQKAR